MQVKFAVAVVRSAALSATADMSNGREFSGKPLPPPYYPSSAETAAVAAEAVGDSFANPNKSIA